ncbi:MAG TPA: AAA family ATPase, partial [Polyangiaceae bacterium]
MDSRVLVGRTRELAVLDETLRSCISGERAILVLSGEPGIGKTRMLEEVASRVLDVGGISVWGRMWEVGLTPPFWPWIQALSALDTPNDPAPSLGSLQGQMDGGGRLARFAEVVTFLKRRAAFGPIALLFDDLHAADASSLQLLEYVAPQLIRHPVLLAIAVRETDTTTETAAVLGRLQRGARRTPLNRLSCADVAELVGDRADVQRVFELSDGNPLFVEELLASQASRGQLGLPDLSSVRAVIRDRVARLPEDARNALAAAAIVGREFRGQIIADMAELGDIGVALQPALTLGMVAMTRPDRFRFSHALVAEAMADELGVGERARLHLRAAHALERHSGSDTSAIAHHLLEAGQLAAEVAVLAAE